MGYLPHTRGDLGATVRLVERTLKPRLREFENVLVTGLSGVIPAAIFCHTYNKGLVVLRKQGDSCHGDPWEGPYDWTTKRYIILDDFMSGGHTMTRLVEFGMHETMRPPEFVLLYERHRQFLMKLSDGLFHGARGLRLRHDADNCYTVVAYPESPEDFAARLATYPRGPDPNTFLAQAMNAPEEIPF